MGVGRDFRAIRLFPGGSLVIGAENKPEDDLANTAIQEVSVAVVSRPDYAHVAHASKDPLTLTDPDWHVEIPNVQPPFDCPGQEVLVIGYLKYTDSEGNPAEHGWAQVKTIEE